MSRFFAKITRILEEITQDLHFFRDYADKLYVCDNNVQRVCIQPFDMISSSVAMRP